MPAPTMQARVSTECRAPRLEKVDQLDAECWATNSPLPDSAESAPTNPLDRAYAVLPDADDLKDELQEYFALGGRQQSHAPNDSFLAAGTMVFATPPRPATLHDLPVTSPLDRAYAILPNAEDVQEELQEYFAHGGRQQGHDLCESFLDAGTMAFTTPPRPAALSGLPVTSPLDRAYAILPNAEDVKEEMEEYLALGRQQQSHAQQEPLAARRTSAFAIPPGRATLPALRLANLLNQSNATLQRIEELRDKLFGDMALLRADLADAVQASAARTTEIRTPPR